MLRILLVDDKPADLELLCGALAHRGCSVDCAASDLEAYRLLENPAGYDLLVTDLNLGYGTTGFDVARAARAGAPALKVVYISAYHIPSEQHRVEDSHVFAKPLRMTELAGQILDAVGASQEAPRRALHS